APLGPRPLRQRLAPSRVRAGLGPADQGPLRGHRGARRHRRPGQAQRHPPRRAPRDRKSTRLNSSHVSISYAVFCLKKKNIIERLTTSNLVRTITHRTSFTMYLFIL